MAKSKKRILWVDDDLMFYRSYHDELAEVYRIDVAKSPEAMWGLLKDHPREHYAGIVLDVLLPFRGMDPEKTNGGLRTGLTLLEMLKESEYSGIPVVIFSIRETKDVDDIGQQYHVHVLRKSEVRISEFIDTAKKEFGV
jgi:CheY-like chemotaxis protein